MGKRVDRAVGAGYKKLRGFDPIVQMALGSLMVLLSALAAWHSCRRRQSPNSRKHRALTDEAPTRPCMVAAELHSEPCLAGDEMHEVESDEEMEQLASGGGRVRKARRIQRTVRFET